MKKSIFLIFTLVCLNLYSDDGNFFTVQKNGVNYRFVQTDSKTDHFVKNIFSEWEQETFTVFEEVRDPEGIAIDLGAWIGTTAIWLSKNFKEVIAVEADRISLDCLKRNLSASDCQNVIICESPIADKEKEVFFGPRGSELNESISTIKTKKNSALDYSVKSITFEDLLLHYRPNNDPSMVSFIKCDIEGGEEDILSDVLIYAYENNCKAYISFHYSWWRNADIEKYEPLFQLFRTNCPYAKVSEFVALHPFGSVLFEPK